MVKQHFYDRILPKLPKLGGGSMLPIDGEDDTPEGIARGLEGH